MEREEKNRLVEFYGNQAFQKFHLVDQSISDDFVPGEQHRLDDKWDSFFRVLDKRAFCGETWKRRIKVFLISTASKLLMTQRISV